MPSSIGTEPFRVLAALIEEHLQQLLAKGLVAEEAVAAARGILAAYRL